MNTRQNSDLARDRQDYADRQTRMVKADFPVRRLPSGRVDVTLPQGEVVRFAGIDEAEEGMDWLENTPPEERGEGAIKGRNEHGANSPAE